MKSGWLTGYALTICLSDDPRISLSVVTMVSELTSLLSTPMLIVACNCAPCHAVSLLFAIAIAHCTVLTIMSSTGIVTFFVFIYFLLNTVHYLSFPSTYSNLKSFYFVYLVSFSSTFIPSASIDIISIAIYFIVLVNFLRLPFFTTI